MADAFLGRDLAVSWLHCLGSMSAETLVTERVQSAARRGAVYSCAPWWFLSWVFRQSHVPTGVTLLSNDGRVRALQRRSGARDPLLPTPCLLSKCELQVEGVCLVFLGGTPDPYICIFFLPCTCASRCLLSLSYMPSSVLTLHRITSFHPHSDFMREV